MPRNIHKENNQNALRGNNVTLAVLSALATGALRVSAFAVIIGAPSHMSRDIRRWQYQQLEKLPHLNVDFEKMLRNAKEKHRIAKALHALRRRRFVRIVRRNGVAMVEISKDGKRYLKKAEIQYLHIAPQTPWDGMWRVVLFDIPEKYRVARDTLRKKLRELGFYQLQKSAFVLPYPCFDELDILIQALGIVPWVTFFETTSLGYHEANAIRFFRIERKRKRGNKSNGNRK